MKHFAATTFFILSCFFASGLSAQETNNLGWTSINETRITITGKRQIVPIKYLTVSLSGTAFKNKLFSAPNEKTIGINESPCVITLPLPNGGIGRFKVVESPIMAEELSAAYPHIKTFSVKGIDDPYANGKIDWNDFGFHAMVRSVTGDFFIDPYCVGNVNDYISYYTNDFFKSTADMAYESDVVVDTRSNNSESDTTNKQKNLRVANSTPAVCVGTQLRVYRLAISCTGEYAIAATGLSSPTIPQTLSKIVTSVNRVDGVYESELAVRMVLVPSTTLVIFTNPATDPYTANSNGPQLLTQSQNTITSYIGSANFDIGHIFSTGGGGIANLGCVCTNATKAMGVTGLPNPVGDPYDIDYVAHEMGHQFEGNHTFNSVTGSCSGNRNAGTSGEPGSGVTIMAYAGICGTNDLAQRSIPYFHAFSYDEIVNFTQLGSGSSCPVIAPTINQPPFVTGSGDYVVPKSTAFILTGAGIDPDNDALTYSWEETDAGLGAGGNWNSGLKPYFRSYPPDTSASRSFPSYSIVLSGNYTSTRGEYAPPVAQILKFRLTARDNKMGGGGVCYAINTVTVDNGGPFKVSNPDLFGVIWNSGTQQTVTWDVNNTDVAPVACSFVRIWISLDGGATYNILNNFTQNDGVQLVTCPTVTTNITTCRIKIEGLGNIFYDVSDNNFTILTSTISVPTALSKVSQNNALGLTVWPNPSTNLLNVAASNLQNTGITELKIVDVLGKVVMRETYPAKVELNETIDISTINDGIYFIQLSNNNVHAHYRFIKQ